jgi:hypothetical protein
MKVTVGSKANVSSLETDFVDRTGFIVVSIHQPTMGHRVQFDLISIIKYAR